MTRELTINTVEELVAWTVQNHYHSTTKWSMWDRTSVEWVDDKAGKHWQFEKDLAESSMGWQSAEFRTFCETWDKEMPAKKMVHDYGLTECTGDLWSRGKYIHLSQELGAQIEAIWTHKKAKWGSGEDRVGNLTIPGMLKRLGKGDLGKAIEDAKAIEKAKSERTHRNSCRTDLRRMAALALPSLVKLGLDQNTTIADLLTLVNEE